MSHTPVIDRPTRRQSATPVETTEATGRQKAPKRGATEPKPTKVKARSVAAPVYRVDLLPSIVGVRRRQNTTLRLLMLSLIGVALIAVVASLAVALLAGAAESTLEQEQARSAQLIADEQQYAEVIAVKAQLADYDNARTAALFAETDWARVMRELDAALPEGAQITAESIKIKGLAGEAGETNPEVATIDAPGVIEISFGATAPTFVAPTPLLNSLQNMTGFVSANVSSVANAGEDGYTISGKIQLDGRALGGTARTASLNQDAIVALRDALVAAAIAPPVVAEAPADGATDAATDAATTGTGE